MDSPEQMSKAVAKSREASNAELIDAVGNNGYTQLAMASGSGNMVEVRRLLAGGESVDKASSMGITPLHIAAQSGQREVAELLLQHGASVDAAAVNGITPLHIAAESGHRDDAKLLLEHGANVDAVTANGVTPLYVTAENGHYVVTALLLQYSASVDGATVDGATPLYVAAQNGHCGITELLLLYCAQVDIVRDNGWTPLHAAAQSGDLETLCVLIDATIQTVECRATPDSNAAISTAARPTKLSHHSDSISALPTARFLSQRTARLDIENAKGDTPVLVAARSGHFDAVRFLVSAGACMHARSSSDGETVLTAAARQGNMSAVSKLFEDGHLEISRSRLSSSDEHGEDEDEGGADKDEPSTPRSLLGATLQTLIEYAAQTHEFQTMWTRVVDRLTRLHSRMAVSRDLPRDSAFQLVMLVSQLVQLKMLISSSDVFTRLVASPAVASQFRDVHTELGFLERSVPDDDASSVAPGGAATDSTTDSASIKSHTVLSSESSEHEVDWNAVCSCDEEALLEQFRVKIDAWSSREVGVGADEANEEGEGDERGDSLRDAAFLLQHFVAVQGESCTSMLRDLLNEALRKVMNAANVSTLPAIPSWFIAQHELYIDVRALAGDSQTSATTTTPTTITTTTKTTVTRGRWSKSTVMTSRLERKAFVNVVDTCFSLNHPNVVRMLGASHLGGDGSPFVVVFESAASTSLREYLKRDEHKHELWQKLFEVSLGLEYLVARGVVLERLRCDDIWIGSDGVAKICAFGCLGVEVETRYTPEAKDQALGQARARKITSDIRWRASECIRGAPASMASSVFSLAMCVVEAMTGDVPWGASESDDMVAMAVSAGQRPDLSKTLSYEERQIIQDMWRSDPSKRPSLGTVSLQMQHQAAVSESERYKLQADRDRAKERNRVVNLDTFRFVELGTSMKTFLENLAQKCCRCKESPEAVTHIVERMRGVFDMLQSQHRRANDPAVGRFVEVLMSFDWFLRDRVSEQSILQREMSQRVSLRSHVFHRHLDEVLELLSLTTVNSIHEWQDDSGCEDVIVTNGVDIVGEQHASVPGITPQTATALQASEAVKIVQFETNELNERFSKLGVSANDTSDTARDPADALATSQIARNTAANQLWRIQLHDLKYSPSADLIGRGAFGDVFKATWRNTSVVVKFMGYEDDGGAYSCNLFLHELRVWFPLRHPHVLKLYGACDVGKRYFVCELAGGGNLLQYVKKSDLNAARGWQLLHQVALGLQYLHEQGVVHNDLKCDNVLIGANGDAKIIDFGLSSIVNRAEVFVDLKKMGAVQWRSPEYLRGERLTPASDVYSFGMLIVEMVTGEPPWGRLVVDPVVRMRVVKQGKLPLQPECLNGVQWNLIRMMCASEPSNRVAMPFVVEKLHQFSSQRHTS